MNKTEILHILKGQRQILSMFIQDNLKKESDKKWYKNMLEVVGDLDVCIKNLEKDLREELLFGDN